jgi:hypothetical protein
MTVTSIQSILRSNLPRGPVGSVGFTGSEGFTGSQGFTGSRGEGFTIKGSVATEQDLANILNPENGDTYVVEQSGEIWVYDSTEFVNLGRFLGYTGSQGLTGFVGSQGELGYTGSRGDTGFTGSRGDTGFTGGQGELGYTGSEGFTGSQGEIGYTGSEGFTGSQGELGYTGSQGELGYTGSIGIQGVQGDTGFIGSQGELGYTGSRGNTGFTGSQGELGYTGSQGELGYTGSRGDTGFTGSQGLSFRILGSVASTENLPDGSTSVPGDGYIVQDTGDLQIWDGTQWVNVGRVVGYTGSAGEGGSGGGNEGFTGSQGFTGSRGDPGPAGGFTGSRGDTGFVGSLGFTGSKGGGLDPWTKVTSNYLAQDGNRIIADTTTGTFAIILPLSPPIGSYVAVTDGNDWSINPVVISSNGALIEGFTDDIVIDIQGITIEFIWDGARWQVIASIGSSGVGVPEGGTSGQVLAKLSDEDYDTAWVSSTAGAVSRYVNFSVIGEIAPPIIGQSRFYPVTPITVVRIYASVSEPPQGGPFTFIVKKNGVSIGIVFSISPGAYTMIPVFVSIPLAPSEYLTADITGSGSRDLHIKMEYL